MKKIFIYLFLTLFICGNVFAGNLNNYIEEGYKITKETSSQKQKTFTLKKGNELVLCIVILHHHETRCYKP